MNYGARIVATFFGVGYTPLCPGTAASIVTTLLIFLLPPLSLMLQLVCIGTLFFVGVWSSGIVEKELGLHDPAIAVIDEVVGMWIVLLAVPHILSWYVAALMLFRFFDIVKPFPIRYVETRFPAGLGIMLDDVIAGFFAAFLTFGFRFLI